ncbi:hypothetical protein F5Y19DRAFT_479254 [Xylariaceae sp. FL1651]|nr:hypothetical protein F5Y19DRAFT_479254 [Xylariaceae sp. FL1651]
MKLHFLSLLSASLLVESAVTKAPSFVLKTPFPNATSTADSPASTSSAIPCFPYEDPDCCIDSAVCTFFTINEQYGAKSLCDPPGSFEYEGGVSSIPGWCCN